MRFAMLNRVANLTEINGRKKCKKLPTDANPSGTFVLRIRYVTKLKIILLSCFG